MNDNGTTTKELAIRQQAPSVALATGPLDIYKLADTLAKSGYFTDAADQAKCVTKILYGAELGIGPVQSIMGINVIKGKPSLSANLMASIIKRSGRYTYRIKQLDDQGCILEFFEASQRVGESAFTRKDAENAQLLGGDNWKKFFRNMAFARALSNGAKWFTPDVFGGPIYVPEEMGAIVDGETGEVIEAGAGSARSATATMSMPAQPAAVLLGPTAIESLYKLAEQHDLDRETFEGITREQYGVETLAELTREQGREIATNLRTRVIVEDDGDAE